MYYATYRGIGDTDIAAFYTKQERDDWVNFKDPYSNALGINAENCTFERMEINLDEVNPMIKTMTYKKDDFNVGQEWYCIE